MNKSIKPFACVLTVSDLMLATGILTQSNCYPVSMLTVWLRLIVLVARFPKKHWKNSVQQGSPRHLNTCIMSDFHTWYFRFVYKLKPMYSFKMVIEHSFQRISLISNYIITNKTWIISLSCKLGYNLIVINTEVKFIKKFLHVEFENCHGQKWLKLTKGLYSKS